MKIFRYLDFQNRIRLGTVEPDGKRNLLKGELFGSLEPTSEKSEVAKILAPLAPTALLGIGLNYRKHAEEGGMRIPEWPIVFMKGLNSLQHPGDPIEIPIQLRSEKVDYECELAVIIGTMCKNASRAKALDYVFGYTCANDVSARDWQLEKGGGQWCRGKSFDTFAPLGPWITTANEIPDPQSLRIKTVINGEVLQDWNTEDMIFDVASLIEFLSGSTSLLPGTVILTGTPHGVGMAQKPSRYLKAGDEVAIEIDKIGTLRNPVRNEQITR
jgi:2-keto-4-pentenoate hydratase/2-oxohepta-3-ene-1,7-dioic acid hydratase in catechol pathway